MSARTEDKVVGVVVATVDKYPTKPLKIPGAPRGQLIMERPCHPSECSFEDCEGGVKSPSQWSYSNKAGLCALFHEGWVKNAAEMLSSFRERGSWG